MTGRQNRDKGKRWEQQLARWFTAHGFGDIRSGRAVTGGTQAGADLVTVTDDGPLWDVNGWSLEAKDKEQSAISGWLNQAADDANGRPHAVIHKNRRHPTDQAHVYLPAVHAQQLLDLDLPADVRHVTVDLHVFTAALARWTVDHAEAA